jgi:hypothetical protein
VLRIERVVATTPQGHGQVEAETVDLHVVGPVPQGVQHETRGGARRRVDGIAAPGDVDVGAVVLLPVVAAVVDTTEAGSRSAQTELGRVVVHHVEDDLDARGVEIANHRLDLAQHRVGPAATASAVA